MQHMEANFGRNFARSWVWNCQKSVDKNFFFSTRYNISNVQVVDANVWTTVRAPGRGLSSAPRISTLCANSLLGHRRLFSHVRIGSLSTPGIPTAPGTEMRTEERNEERRNDCVKLFEDGPWLAGVFPLYLCSVACWQNPITSYKNMPRRFMSKKSCFHSRNNITTICKYLVDIINTIERMYYWRKHIGDTFENNSTIPSN